MILQQVMKLTCVYKKLESFTQISYRQHTCLNICTRRKKVTLKTCIHVTPLLYWVYTILFHVVFFNSLPLLLYVQSAKIRVKRQTQIQLYLCMSICKCIFIYECIWDRYAKACEANGIISVTYAKKTKENRRYEWGTWNIRTCFSGFICIYLKAIVHWFLYNSLYASILPRCSLSHGR